MTVHARRIASIPRRSSVDTWRVICDLVAPAGSAARVELDSVTGVAAMIIAEEYTRDAPAIVSGVGPQVRIYTLHGDDAIEADFDSESPLALDPTAGDWSLSLPCGVDDMDEAETALESASHVSVRELTAGVTAGATAQTKSRPIIDLNELERP